jgi:transcriptional regulator with XRE-family HTH domain
VSSQRLKERVASVGQRIRELRMARGMTQEQLGERAGLSYKAVGEIERGLGNPTIGTLDTIAAALQIDLSALFDTAPGRLGGIQLYPLTKADVDLAREALDSLDTVLSKASRRRVRRPAPKR